MPMQHIQLKLELGLKKMTIKTDYGALLRTHVGPRNQLWSNRTKSLFRDIQLFWRHPV